jgi:hypothetical protein
MFAPTRLAVEAVLAGAIIGKRHNDVVAGFHPVYLGANAFNNPWTLVPQYARQREG